MPETMLAGLKVVELATYIAAPGAGAILADWGAEVIKVEAPGGDPIRGLLRRPWRRTSTANPVFEIDNRGKRGIVLDITKPEGREALLRLLARGRRLPHQHPPRRPEAGAAGLRQPAADNPRLIYCQRHRLRPARGRTRTSRASTSPPSGPARAWRR